MLSAFILTTILLTMPANHNNEVIKLVNTKTGSVFVEFKNGHPQFYNWLLEAILKDWGVSIPYPVLEQFEGKYTIFPDDPLFEKAFVEIYYERHLNDPCYQWVKE